MVVLRRLIEKNNLQPVCQAYGLSQNDLGFVEELIRGEPASGRPASKAFLFEVSGKFCPVENNKLK